MSSASTPNISCPSCGVGLSLAAVPLSGQLYPSNISCCNLGDLIQRHIVSLAHPPPQLGVTCNGYMVAAPEPQLSSFQSYPGYSQEQANFHNFSQSHSFPPVEHPPWSSAVSPPREYSIAHMGSDPLPHLCNMSQVQLDLCAQAQLEEYPNHKNNDTVFSSDFHPQLMPGTTAYSNPLLQGTQRDFFPPSEEQFDSSMLETAAAQASAWNGLELPYTTPAYASGCTNFPSSEWATSAPPVSAFIAVSDVPSAGIVEPCPDYGSLSDWLPDDPPDTNSPLLEDVVPETNDANPLETFSRPSVFNPQSSSLINALTPPDSSGGINTTSEGSPDGKSGDEKLGVLSLTPVPATPAFPGSPHSPSRETKELPPAMHPSESSSAASLLPDLPVPVISLKDPKDIPNKLIAAKEGTKKPRRLPNTEARIQKTVLMQNIWAKREMRLRKGKPAPKLPARKRAT